VPRQHPAEAKQNCWVSANAVIPICAHCWCMERDRWFIGPRLRPTVAVVGSTTNNRDWEQQELALRSPTKMHASSGH
jgi:hypothetical protein